jgi:pimeloyl-ACP methyl ester carboxylesterase
LFHPSLSSSQVWHDLGYVEALSQDWKLILIDARGHGESEKPVVEESYSMPRMVDDVTSVLDALEVQTAHFFGYSLGGRVAFGCGAFAPERFRSLIIGGGTYHSPQGAFDRVSYPGALDTIAQDGVERFLEQWSTHAQVVLPGVVRAMFENNDEKAMVPYLRQMELDPSLEDALPNIDLRALLFAGENDDDRLPPTRKAAALMPNAEMFEVPNATHMSALFQSSVVLEHVSQFLVKVEENRRSLAAAGVR